MLNFTVGPVMSYDNTATKLLYRSVFTTAVGDRNGWIRLRLNSKRKILNTRSWWTATKNITCPLFLGR